MSTPARRNVIRAIAAAVGVSKVVVSNVVSNVMAVMLVSNATVASSGSTGRAGTVIATARRPARAGTSGKIAGPIAARKRLIQIRRLPSSLPSRLSSRPRPRSAASA
jgi:hypothetical protein